MKTKLYKAFSLLLVICISSASYAAITFVSPNTILDANTANPSASYFILGGSLDVSHWDFNASGFQIDGGGSNAFGLLYNANQPFALKPLNLNDPIGPSAVYASGGFATAYYSTNFGAPSVIGNNQSAYFGFRVVVGAQNHYGWLKITRTSSSVVVLNEYAYENTANTPINVGQTGTVTTLVSSITVNSSGASINTMAGTMPMSVAVLPANATNSNVTWSVNNANATISATGLLTAVTDGAVIVTATANDGSNVTGTKTITITNQSVAVKDIISEDLVIYPNPVHRQIVIKGLKNNSKINYSITSINGALTQTGMVVNNKISLNDLSEGTYYLMLTQDYKRQLIPFVKD